MNRRRVLSGVGAVVGGSLGGCAGRFVGTSGSLDCAGPRVSPPSTGDHHLYVENLDAEARRLCLEVVNAETDEQVLAGEYEIPDERGGEFPEVARWTETYEVTVRLAAGVSETFTWEVGDCGGAVDAETGEEIRSGSRNGSVRIAAGADDLSFVVDACDEIVAGNEVPTGQGEAFAVDGSE